MFDAERWEVVDEVLVGRGGVFDPEGLSLLDSHRNRSSLDVYGRAFNFRQEQVRGKNFWVATLEFDRDDPDGLKLWRKVSKKFVRGISIGYQIANRKMVDRGAELEIDGVVWRASATRALRVATKWIAREVSTTPVQADPEAKTRMRVFMNKRLIEYLKRFGFKPASETTQQEVNAFIDSLAGFTRAVAECLNYSIEEDGAEERANATLTRWGRDLNDPSKPVGEEAPAPTPTTERTSGDPPSNPPSPTLDERAIQRATEEAVATALQRRQDWEQQVRYAVRAAGEAVTANDLEMMLRENWSIDRVHQYVLDAIENRRMRQSGGSNLGGHEVLTRMEQMVVEHAPPAMQTRSVEQVRNLTALSMALARTRGVTAERSFATLERETPRVFHLNDSNRDQYERQLEYADRMVGISVHECAIECLRMNGISVGYNKHEIMDALKRSAHATATLTALFSNAFAAEFMEGHDSVPDVTPAFTSEGSHSNFYTTEKSRLAIAEGRLSVHPRGGEAEMATIADAKESWKIARYSKQFVVDDMDLIDDRFGKVDQAGPAELGEGAKNLRPDLVFSLIAGGQTMRDGVALFHTATHLNLLTTNALAPGTIKESIIALNLMTEGGRQLTTTNGFVLLIPETLVFDADRFCNSPWVNEDSGDGVKNTLLTKSFQIVSDGRLDNGVADPRDDYVTTHAGSTSTWYLVRKGTRKGLEVTYLRGASRLPSVESFVLTGATWGIGWKIKHDIGGGWHDWRHWIKNTA